MGPPTQGPLVQTPPSTDYGSQPYGAPPPYLYDPSSPHHIPPPPPALHQHSRTRRAILILGAGVFLIILSSMAGASAGAVHVVEMADEAG